MDAALAFGAHEVIDGANGRFEDAVAPVDLVFDTVGAELLERSAAVLRKGGRVVSVAEEPPQTAPGAEIDSHYFVVEPNRRQLVEIARLIDDDVLRVAVDSVFPLFDARAAFERTLASGKRGKVVLRVAET